MLPMFSSRSWIYGVFAGASFLFAASCVPSGPEPILSGQPTPTFVSADVADVYIAVKSPSGMSISRFNKRKQLLSPVTVVHDTMTKFVVHDDFLYWLRASQPSGRKAQPVVMRVNKFKPGKPQPAVTSSVPVTGFTFDATHMYWTQGGDPKDKDETLTPGVLRVMSIGSTPTNFVTKQPGTSFSPALSGADLFWVNADPGGDFVVMTTRKGGHETPRELFRIPSGQTEGHAPPLAADDDGVFVLTRSAVMHIAQSNGQVRKLFQPIHPTLGLLALDVSSLYFNADNRGFVRLSVKGGAPQVLNPKPVPFATLDDQFVYWTSPDAVLRLQK